MNWVLVVFEEQYTNRMEYKLFESIVDAFTTGNDLVKSKSNSYEHYRVEKFMH